MIQLLGTIVCIASMIGLFVLDRDREAPSSKALWIPAAWLLINGSRAVSSWLHTSTDVSLAQQYTDGSPIDAAVYGVLIVAGITVLNIRSHRVKAFLRANMPLLLFFAYCALSVVWSDHSFIALKRWTKSVGDLVMLMVILTDRHPRIAIRRLFASVAFVLLPMSALFIKCYPELGSVINPENGTTMYIGVTTFKNLLGMTSMVFGLASLWSLIGAYRERGMPNRFRHLIAHGAMVGTAVWLIVTADSMTSLSCFVLAGSVIVLSTQSWVVRRPGSLHAIVCAAIGFPLFALFLNTVGTLVHSLGRNTTLTGRTAIWNAVLSLHTNPIVGTGFESFWLGSRLESVWNMSVKGIQEAHNGYIEIYLNLGWVGLLLLGWLVVAGYRNAFTAFRYCASDGRLRLAYLTAALIFSLTEAGFRMLSPIWFAFLLAVVGVPSESLLDECLETPALAQAQFAQRKQMRILQ